MANNPPKKTTTLSKKHLDRMHREKQQTKWITIGAIVAVLLAVGSIGYGILYQNVLIGLRAVANVNGEKITVNEFRSYTKYYRYQLIQSAQRTYDFASMFGSDPQSLQQFGSQLVSISGELDANRAGQSALDQMVADKLIRQEAKKRGITVSPDEVEKRMQEAFRFYANGTPTPSPTAPIVPTATLSPLQMTMVPPTATNTATPAITATVPVTGSAAITNTANVSATLAITPTPAAAATETPTLAPSAPVITATATPQPTETPFTIDAYKKVYATQMADFLATEIPEAVIRSAIESVLYREKLQKVVIGEVPCVEDQVWAQHILVKDEATAQLVLGKLQAGEDWAKLASTYSTDTSNKDKSGDLGWFNKTQMVKEFADAAFAMTTPGQISPPVKTQFGYHIIRLVAHESRPISAAECTRQADTKFTDWLTSYKATAQIQTYDTIWTQNVPLLPTLPANLQQVIQSIQGAGAPPSAAYPAPVTP
jgi:parvulin-like peptidyl-prolyl isomerase